MSPLKFITFDSSKVFELWQTQNPNCEIFQCSPMLVSAGVNFDSEKVNMVDRTDGGMTTNIGVFVLFREKD